MLYSLYYIYCNILTAEICFNEPFLLLNLKCFGRRLFLYMAAWVCLHGSMLLLKAGPQDRLQWRWICVSHNTSSCSCQVKTFLEINNKLAIWEYQLTILVNIELFNSKVVSALLLKLPWTLEIVRGLLICFHFVAVLFYNDIVLIRYYLSVVNLVDVRLYFGFLAVVSVDKWNLKIMITTGKNLCLTGSVCIHPLCTVLYTIFILLDHLWGGSHITLFPPLN